MCDSQMSGGAVLSNRLYAAGGDFEFKIRPSMTEGVTTVLGLANDSENPSDMYAQIMFDASLFGLDKYAVVIGSQSIDYFNN